MEGLGLTNPTQTAASEYAASVKITAPLVEQTVSQVHEPPDDDAIRTIQQSALKEKDERLRRELEDVKNSPPQRTKRAVDLATEKGASSMLTVIPIKDMDFNLNKGEFRDGFRLR